MHRLARFSWRAPGITTFSLLPRLFSSTPLAFAIKYPSRPKPPPDSEIEESYLKGSGPGGQKINKTNSAVQLKHVPTNIVVKSQATRSRSQNRKIARDLLAQRLDEHFNGEQSRTAVVGDIKRNKAASKAKKSRRKYRKLEEGKEGAVDSVEDTEDIQPDREALDGEKQAGEQPVRSPEGEAAEDSGKKP